MANDRQNGWQASGEGERKNWGEDSREERHPDPETPAEGGEGAEEDLVDLESEESFPASDAPSFTPKKVD